MVLQRVDIMSFHDRMVLYNAIFANFLIRSSVGTRRALYISASIAYVARGWVDRATRVQVAEKILEHASGVLEDSRSMSLLRARELSDHRGGSQISRPRSAPETSYRYKRIRTSHPLFLWCVLFVLGYFLRYNWYVGWYVDIASQGATSSASGFPIFSHQIHFLYSRLSYLSRWFE